jgi:hypothetical protein
MRYKRGPSDTIEALVVRTGFRERFSPTGLAIDLDPRFATDFEPGEVDP